MTVYFFRAEALDLAVVGVRSQYRFQNFKNPTRSRGASSFTSRRWQWHQLPRVRLSRWSISRRISSDSLAKEQMTPWKRVAYILVDSVPVEKH